LKAESYQHAISSQTFVHLVGVSNPSPVRAKIFRSIDLPAAYASVDAAVHARVQHFFYLSVAHPAPVMKAYAQTRMEAEEKLCNSGLNAIMLRPRLRARVFALKTSPAA
jgi:hypothetical protein